jgi:mannosyltransferase OCH1-like enzyme
MSNIFSSIKQINTLNKKQHQKIYNQQQQQQQEQQQHQQQEQQQEQQQQQQQQHLTTQFKQTDISSSVIPLNIFQTWHTLKLPHDMNKNMLLLKQQNTEFTHYLYDDNMCKNFICNNFDKDVLYAYNTLKPGAYKADLWRYCILYKYGGIYLDIKYSCINNFKLINLTDKEYFCRDHNNGIYQAILCCLPNNPILYKCIQEIVKNTKTKNFTNTRLSVTGPQLNTFMTTFNNVNLELEIRGFGLSTNILYKNISILKAYNTYRNEQRKNQLLPPYGAMWNKRDIYNYIS